MHKDRLTGYQDPSGATTTYSYDLGGTRQAKGGAAGTVNVPGRSRITRPGCRTDRRRDGGRRLNRSFVYGVELLQTARSSGRPNIANFDHIDSTLVVDQHAGGPITDTFDYQAYGNATQSHRVIYDCPAPLRWPKKAIPESGLTYLRARYYDPAHGGLSCTRDPSLGRPERVR